MTKLNSLLSLLVAPALCFAAGCSGAASPSDSTADDSEFVPDDPQESDDTLGTDGKADSTTATSKVLGSWIRIDNPTGGSFAGFRFSVVNKKRVFFGESIAVCEQGPCARTRMEGSWTIGTKSLTLISATGSKAYYYAVSGGTLTLTDPKKKTVLGNLQAVSSFCTKAPDCDGQIPFNSSAPPSVLQCNYDSTCQTVPRADRTVTSALQFPNQSGKAVQHGIIVAGSKLGIDYDLSRLTKCRNTHNGYPAWDIRVSVKFMPSGTVIDASVNGMLVPERRLQLDGTSGYTEVQVPDGTQQVIVWAYNQSSDSSGQCEDWDSNGGANYSFAVASSAASIKWAGDWGQGFSHQCAHQNGLEEPLELTVSKTSGTCMLIDADVFAAGITDNSFAHPEKIAAMVEYSVDGQPTQTGWLSYQGRVGNNYRFRWDLPYAMRMTRFENYKYAFKFAAGDPSWFRLAQGAGPDGGQARTIHKAY